jgi:hypothetical protein
MSKKTLHKKKAAWKEYESYILEHLKGAYPNDSIELDQKVKGHISGTSRQVDILIIGSIGGHSIRVAIDCKCYAKKIDIKHVETFIGMLADLKVNKGVMITNVGYTGAALERAKKDNQDIQLDILDFEDLASFRGDGGGVAHRNEGGAIFPCPSGWIMHPYPNALGNPVTFTPVGMTIEDGMKNRSLMYLNFGSRSEFLTLDAYLSYHQLESKLCTPELKSKIEDIDINLISKELGLRNVLRTMQYNDIYEQTIFLEYPEFYVFIVAIMKKNLDQRIAKKLSFIAKQLIPVNPLPYKITKRA